MLMQVPHPTRGIQDDLKIVTPLCGVLGFFNRSLNRGLVGLKDSTDLNPHLSSRGSKATEGSLLIHFKTS